MQQQLFVEFNTPNEGDLNLFNKPTDEWKSELVFQLDEKNRFLYMASYFFIVSPLTPNKYQYFYWNVNQNRFIYDIWTERLLGNEKSQKELTNYFRDKLPKHILTFIPNYYNVFIRPNENKFYFNIAPNVSAFNTTPFNSFSDEAKSGVQIFWNHLKKVWCNDNEQVFEYNKNWIINTVLCKKNGTVLLNISKHGTGKSTLSDFLVKKVFSLNASAQATPNNVFGLFNDILMNKCLIVFDEYEMPQSKAQRTKIFNMFKSYITNDIVAIKRLRCDDINYPNCLNFIIHSNSDISEALPFPNTERRFLANDISDEYVENSDYFTNINKVLYETENIGEAFYAYCRENYNKDYNMYEELKKFETHTGSQIRAQNLHPVFKYIKDEYLMKKNELKRPLTSLLSEMNNNTKYKLKNLDFNTLHNQLERAHLINTYDTDINVSVDNLYNIAEKEKWLSDIEKKRYEETISENELLNVYINQHLADNFEELQI